MKVSRALRENAGSCSFCFRGKSVNHKTVWPYKEVWVVTSEVRNGSPTIRFCDQCRDQFVQQATGDQ